MNRISLFAGTFGLVACLVAFQHDKGMKSSLKLSKDFKKEYGFVRGGQALIDEEKVTVGNFMMSKGEVTNGEYAAFLADLLAAGELEKYAIAKVDTTKWHSIGGSLEPMASHYHSHPAFANYPVGNISKEGAQMYCEWLTEKMKKTLPAGVQMTFRLPTQGEWMRAACGDDVEANYTWKGTYLRNSQGYFLANFVQVPDYMIGRDENGKFVYKDEGIRFGGPETDAQFITAVSKSYYPNEFDLYNMNGNVAEMLHDRDLVIGGSWYDTGYDIRNQSVRNYIGAAPTVGFRVVGLAAGL